FVDTAPPPPGFPIGEFEVVDGVVPFPGWDFFDEPDVRDLDDATRARTAPMAKSVPARVPADPIALRSTARFAVPVTLLMGGHDKESMEEELANWGPFADEFHAIQDAEVVTLGSGHWPQFSMPERLAEAIITAVDRCSATDDQLRVFARFSVPHAEDAVDGDDGARDVAGLVVRETVHGAR